MPLAVTDDHDKNRRDRCSTLSKPETLSRPCQLEVAIIELELEACLGLGHGHATQPREQRPTLNEVSSSSSIAVVRLTHVSKRARVFYARYDSSLTVTEFAKLRS